MKVSYEGIGAWSATFETADAREGQVVKLSAPRTVSPCAAGDAFCGVAGPVALLVHFCGLNGYWALLILPVVYWACLVMKRHTPSQLLLGTITPLISLVLVLLIY